MRVTDRMGFNQVTSNLQRNRSEVSDLQNQAATQRRLIRPSDDPVASTRVLSARTDGRGNQQFIKNINLARSFLEYSDESLAELSDVLIRLKELALQQASDAGASLETRRIVAMEVAQAFHQAIQIGNRKLGERYIFGGYNTTQTPFDSEGSYHGDDGEMKIHINKEAFLSMNIPGGRVFLGENLGSDGLIREKSHVPKTASEWRQAQSQLKDESLDNPDLNNSDEIQSLPLRGPASLRSQKSAIVTVRDKNSEPESESLSKSSRDGIIEGGDHSVSVLNTVKNFEIALRVGDKELIQSSINALDQALSQVIHARASIGARIQTLNHTTDGLQKQIVDLKATASQLEDADLFQVVSDISKADSTLKATLETSGRIIQPGLLEFLK